MDVIVTNSTAASKRAFLARYLDAGDAAMAATNIESGRKWAALWPISTYRSPSTSTSGPKVQLRDKYKSCHPPSSPAKCECKSHSVPVPV
ncbi:hypothetical protein LY78DRAFT_709838 [Colletotrichum sublineola]|nr:hypothetical protein LY78DRAFT_709838 [Colletotrichum sublineola]